MSVNNDGGIVRRVEPAVKRDSRLGSKKKTDPHMICLIAAGVTAGRNARRPAVSRSAARDSHERPASAGGWKMIFDFGDGALALDGDGKSGAGF